MIESRIDEFLLEQYGCQHNKVMYGTSHFGVFPEYDKFRGKDTCVGARFIAADYWDILPCPYDVIGGMRARYQWYREFLPEDEVAHLFEDGTFEGNFDDVPKGGVSEEEEWHKDLLREIGWEDYEVGSSGLMEVFHRFSNGHIKTIINRGYIARDTEKSTPNDAPLPYNVPFLDMRYIIFPGEYFGMGVPEALEQLQKDLQLIRSQHRENVDMTLNGIIKVNRNADVDIDDLEFYPQAIWLLENMDDVEVYTPPDVTTQSVLAIEGQVRQDMERAAGRTRYGMGLTPTHGRETATTVMRLQQAGAARIDTQIKLTEGVSIRGLGWQLALIMQDKLNPDIFEQITGASKEVTFADTDKWELKYKVDAHPLGSSITRVKEIMSEQMLRILEIIKSIDPRLLETSPTKSRIEYGELIKMVVKSTGLSSEEVKKIIVPGEAIPPGQLGDQQDLNQLAQARAQFEQKGGGTGAGSI